MKKKIYILLLLLPLALLLSCSREQGELTEDALYQRYAVRQELKVAQVSGMKLCDTVRVNVVLLQADDDETWQQLKEEFLIEGEEGVESWLGDTEQPAQRVKWTGAPVVRAIASHSRRTLAFYRLDTEAQYDALLDYQLEKMNKEKK